MRLILAVVALVASAGTARGQARPTAAMPGDTVLATPDARYEAGWLHRLMLNRGHRELWSIPVQTEVLDLDRFAGGVRVLGPGGGQQTRSLRLLGPDGTEYRFRSIDKDVSRGLDPTLRNSIAERVMQDQVGSLLPTGALVVAPLLEAAGVLHPDPHLYVMPDDPRLGEHREIFAGLLGLVEVQPNEGPADAPGFAGSPRVTGSEAFLERLEDHPRNRIDAHEYLRARLIDFLVGDWDRHPDQWRWASFEEGDSIRWSPVPRDRDWAFARLDGLLIKVAGIPFPGYLGFSDRFADVYRVSWNGRALDRRLLSELAASAYDSVARDVQARITDDVIESAVSRLPAGHREAVGAELEAGLRARRDGLLEIARAFYALLAEWTDIDTTDSDETAVIERLPGGHVRVTVRTRSRHVFARSFDPAQTREVRLYLHGGEDSVVVRGAADADTHITVRVIGGGGDDVFTDETTGRAVSFHDHRGDNRFRLARATRLDVADWDEPPPGALDPAGSRPRDWGSWWLAFPSITLAPDIGLMLGASTLRFGYGFRHLPWKTRLGLSVAVSTSGVVRAGLRYDAPLIGRSTQGRFEIRASGLEVDRFYGFGNETVRDAPDDDRFHARRRTLDASVSVQLRPSARTTVGIGPVVRVSRSVEEAGTLIAETRPYGYGGTFTVAGVALDAGLDTRDVARAATRGVLLQGRVEHVPSWFDATSDWTALQGLAATYVTPAVTTRPTLAVRVGAQHRFGRFPYTEAAYLGGPDDLRGFATRRFAGRSAAWGNAEMRIPVMKVFILLPLDIGVSAVADGGRVWVPDERSDRWHAAAGGGLWFSVLGRANAASATLARSREGYRFYVRGGFAF